ncbi:MAG: hypothetical protein J0M09_08090 [Xanthomonadales bacterium]|nr:hypothetical protein [Xanthomonadales bacterium]
MPAFRSGRRRAGDFFAPRKPRHRVLRVVLALFGVALLAVLLVFGLMIGAAMLGGGLLYRLWRQRGKPIAKQTRPLDAEYRVLRKPMLTAGR